MVHTNEYKYVKNIQQLIIKIDIKTVTLTERVILSFL